MADDGERLVVLLEARIRDFEKNLQKASGTADTHYGRMRRTSRSATRDMEQDMQRSTARINQALAASSAKIGSYGKMFATSLAGGALGGLGAGALAASLAGAASSIAQIGDEAARAGLSLKVFQEWKGVAEDTRIPLDAMIDAFKELNIRADEFATTGKGSAADAFARLGMSPQEVKERLKDPSDFMLEIITRTKALKNTAAGARVFDEILGGTGAEQLVRLLGLADGEIKKIIDGLHDSGRVISGEVVNSAAELDRRFNKIANTVGTSLKRAIVEAAQALTDFINAFNGFEFERTTKLGERIAALGQERMEVEKAMADLRDMQRGGAVGAGDGIFGSSFGESTIGEAMADHERRMEAIAAEEQMILRILENRKKAEAPTTSTWTPPKYDPPGDAARDKAAEAAEKQAAAVRKLISDLEHELSVIGMSNTEKEIANTLRRAGVDATSKEGQTIAELVRQIDAETEAHNRAKKATEARAQAFENVFQMATDGLLSVMDGSVKAEDAVKKLAVQLALAAAQAALMGTGPLAGLFGGGGGLFGALFKADGGIIKKANGGVIRGPGTGTSDSIPAMLSDGEFIVNSKATKKHRGLLEQINADGLPGFRHGGAASALPLPGGGHCDAPRSFGEVLA